MKLAYNNILDFLHQKPSINDISEKLFQLGHENEIIDGFIDIDITPNRGDCLSAQGIARDLGVFFNFKNDLKLYENSIEELKIDFVNKSPNDCPFISLLNIEIEKNDVVSYKPYLDSYFNELDIKKNNLFTDVSNYINYEIGQPSHCYDKTKLGSSFEFNNIKLQEKFQTVIGKDIEITGKNCVFIKDGKVINLAGVMGGMTTSCNKRTTNVIIEFACFKSESIIGKAVKYDLHSDASYKFERGVDPYLQDLAVRRFIKIISDHADIKEVKLYKYKSEPIHYKKINFDVSKINSILGTNITKSKCIDYLHKLGFMLENEMIKVPSHRYDIEHQNDLAEEIARVIGYNNIGVNQFNAIANTINKNNKEKIVKDFLIDNGFNEVINTPFCDEINSNYNFKIDNPLDSSKRFMRSELKSSLLTNLLSNESRQNDSIKLFEIADIYTKSDVVNSLKVLGIIISGRVGENYIDFSKKLDIPYLKNLFKKIDIELDEKKIKLISRDSIKTKLRTKIFYLEMPIKDIPVSIMDYVKIKKENLVPFKKYKPVSEYPSSTRDISFLLSDELVINDLENKLLNFKSENLKKVFVFDFFKKNKNYIKIGFRFVFQSRFSTLKVEEIDNEMLKIIESSTNINGVEIPGIK